MQHRLSSKGYETKSIPLQILVEMLRKTLEETQKYKLLTTNQYLPQMELLVEIVDDICQQFIVELFSGDDEGYRLVVPHRCAGLIPVSFQVSHPPR